MSATQIGETPPIHDEHSMHANSTFRSRCAIGMLAVALTAGGMLVPFTVPLLIERLPNMGFPVVGGVHLGIYILGCIFISLHLGALAAWLVWRSRARRWIRSLLVSAWVSAILALFFVQPTLEQPVQGQLEWAVVVYCSMVILLTASQFLSLAYLGRSERMPVGLPYFLVAFVFLGYALGLAALPMWWLPERGGDEVVPIFTAAMHGAFVLVGVFQLLFLFLHLDLDLALTRPMAIELGDSIRQNWHRRLRWVLLAFLPACATYSANDNGFDERMGLGDGPWLIYFFSWIVAFTRFTAVRRLAPGALVMLATVLALCPILSATLARFDLARFDRGPTWHLAVLAGSCAVFVPHRWTRIAASAFLAVVFMQMFAQLPIGPFWSIFSHASLLALVCWGCHGDAVKDAPGADQLPEFAVCIYAGWLGSGGVYLGIEFLDRSVFKWAYAAALVGCLVLRAVPWPPSQHLQRANGAEKILDWWRHLRL